MTPIRRYSRGRKLVAMRDVQAGTSRYYHYDHQGTTQCLTDGNGNVTDRFAADAWGVQVKRTGSSINRQWYVGNWGYYGQTPIDDCYVRARHYAPLHAAWTSRDRQPGQTWYAYPRKPTLMTDPTGDRPVPSDCAKFPGGPCAYALVVARDVDLATERGTTICCDGKAYACVFPGEGGISARRLSRRPAPPVVVVGGGAGSYPWLTACVAEHELDHLRRTNCPAVGYCSDKAVIAPRATECTAYLAELACLKKMKPNACPADSTPGAHLCRAAYNCILIDVLFNVRFECNAAGMPNQADAALRGVDLRELLAFLEGAVAVGLKAPGCPVDLTDHYLANFKNLLSGLGVFK